MDTVFRNISDSFYCRSNNKAAARISAHLNEEIIPAGMDQ